ncbi:MAG: hypothetical protein KJ061_07880 [Vicinamibacteraceae bacterium]|nr:hypothetical protein [Vicinamibacteraceae bacterium]
MAAGSDAPLVMPVTMLRRASPNAWHLELAAHAPPAFEAGQAMLLGLHGQPLRKPYSIACSPDEAVAAGRLMFLLGTEDEDDIGLHLRGAAPGRLVEAEGPLGSFVLPARLDASHVLLLAGGTGIAPLRAMWRALVVRAPDTRVTLHYSARSSAHFVFLDEFRQAAAASGGRFEVVTHTTRSDRIEDAPRGVAGGIVHRRRSFLGRIDRARLATGLDAESARAFVCGPPGFVDHLTRTLGELGLASWRIHAERW